MKPFRQINKRFTSISAQSIIAVAALTACVSSADVIEIDGEHYVKTDRYTLVSIDTKPEQMSPLLAVVDIQFSKHITTIGGALNELLEGSGYRWDTAAERNDELGNLPLPVVVRQVGPVRLRDALITMAGTAWHLNVDETKRTLWFVPATSAMKQPTSH